MHEGQQFQPGPRRSQSRPLRRRQARWTTPEGSGSGAVCLSNPLEVAELVSSALVEPDTSLVIAALLHDTVEDAGVTKEELIQKFGSDVANLVMEMTDDKSLPKTERKRLQIVNAPKKSVRAQVIKLADKVSNLRAILASPPTDWTVDRKREYFDWAKRVVDGLTEPNPLLKAEFERMYRMAVTLQ